MNEEGIAGFFKGAMMSLLLVSNTMINIVIYESLKKLAI